MRHTASYPAETASVTRARLWLRSVLDGEHPTEQSRGAELCVSELAANAVRHAGTGFEVEVSSEGDGSVRIAVSDRSREPVRPRQARSDDVTGRGLQIVDAVATRWGVDESTRGKTVWCTIDP